MVFIKINVVLAVMCLVFSIFRLASKKFGSSDKYRMDRIFICIGILALPLMLAVERYPVRAVSAQTMGIVSRMSPQKVAESYHFVKWGMAAAFAVGCAIFFILFIRYCRESRILREAVPVPGEAARELSFEELGLDRRRILLSDRISAPVTWGFFMPKILIPSYLKDEEEEKYTQIVLHEFIHAKRRDNLWKFLALFLLCAYWQHPYLWFFYFTFLREVELSCDEEVLRRIGEDGRAAYAGTLVAFAGLYCRLSRMTSQLSAGSLKRRVIAIMNYKKSNKRTGIAGKIFMGSIVFSFALLLGFSNQIFAGMRDGETIVKSSEESKESREKPQLNVIEEAREIEENKAQSNAEEIQEIPGNGAVEEITEIPEENAYGEAQEIPEVSAYGEAEDIILRETTEAEASVNGETQNMNVNNLAEAEDYSSGTEVPSEAVDQSLLQEENASVR